jgi:uncharacterized protein YndB with AHSA1/START domain
MIRSKVTFTVNRPIEQVFSYALQPQSLPAWMPNVLDATNASETPLREGSTFTIKVSDGKKEEEMMGRVMLSIPNEKWSFLATGPNLWFRRVMEFKPSANGTEVTYSEERMRRDSGFGLMSLFMGESFQKVSEEGCENFRKILENSTPLEKPTFSETGEKTSL